MAQSNLEEGNLFEGQEPKLTPTQKVISNLMDGVLNNVLNNNPFDVDAHHANKPLYAALVPDEIFKGSHFERRFTTPFGGTWEQLALAIAKSYHGHCAKGFSYTGMVKKGRLEKIDEILRQLEHPISRGVWARTPDWDAELKEVLKEEGELVPVTVVCDIFVDSKTTGQKMAFEFKAPLPNSDQTKVSKEKMLKLMAMEEPVDAAYYGLTYNPYGPNKEDYAWPYPERWFRMKEDPCVLIGSELWELLGGQGAYAQMIKDINDLGSKYKDRIYREYLNMEPPTKKE